MLRSSCYSAQVGVGRPVSRYLSFWRSHAFMFEAALRCPNMDSVRRAHLPGDGSLSGSCTSTGRIASAMHYASSTSMIRSFGGRELLRVPVVATVHKVFLASRCGWLQPCVFCFLLDVFTDLPSSLGRALVRRHSADCVQLWSRRRCS